MEHRPLGRTGVSVSKFCLGAMMFGAWGNPDHDDSIRIIHAALDAGINFIDTADVYGHGESEEIVGKALAGGRRDDIILATKFHNAMGEDPNQRGNSRRWIIRAVEDSLRRLGTDWIDLYVLAAQSRQVAGAADRKALARSLVAEALGLEVVGAPTGLELIVKEFLEQLALDALRPPIDGAQPAAERSRGGRAES